MQNFEKFKMAAAAILDFQNEKKNELSYLCAIAKFIKSKLAFAAAILLIRPSF